MGLASSMAKITRFTSKLTSLTPNNLHANIPANGITTLFGVEGDYGFGSISDIKNSISDLKEGVATAATIGYCSYVMFSDGRKTARGILANIATGSAAIITDIWNQIADAIAAQVSMAVGQIIGMVTNLVSALQNLVASVLLLSEGILSVIKSWSDWANFAFQLEIEKENCKDMFSAIAACYLNKILGPYIEQFTSTVVGKINEIGNTFNEALYDSFQDVNMFSSYANQEAFLLQKANIQIKGLTKENLLGYNE